MIPRRKPLARSAPPARSTPVKRVNRARKQSELLRCYGPPERRAWIRSLPSVVSGLGPCDNVHVKGGGGSRKADACWIVPLTRAEHLTLHRWGRARFEEAWDVNLAASALGINTRWLADSQGAP